MAIAFVVAFSSGDLVSRPARVALDSTGNGRVWQMPDTGRMAMGASKESTSAVAAFETYEVQDKRLVGAEAWSWRGEICFSAHYMVPGDSTILATIPGVRHAPRELLQLAIEMAPGVRSIVTTGSVAPTRRDTAEVDGVAVAFDVYVVGDRDGEPVEFWSGVPIR